MNLFRDLKEALNYAASTLKGLPRRIFMAKTVEAAGPGGQRAAERELGWDRDTIRKGALDARAEVPVLDQRAFNGPKPRIDAQFPLLRQHLREILEPHCQTDPKFTSTRIYIRLSVAQVVQGLIDTKGYNRHELPCDETFRKLLNEMGYTVRKVKKCKPAKKVPEADQIFETVRGLNRDADDSKDDEILRLSLDTKARVHVGQFSRGGCSRVQKTALDHDFDPDLVVVPMGIFIPKHNEMSIDLYDTRAPADAWVDSLIAFWERNRERFPKTKQLLLNLDNGPENNSYRTQFIARLADFANKTRLVLTLAYYPPYQSKYNPVERCWGVLENHWSGEILDSLEAVVGMASTMTYNGVRAVVRVVDRIYDRGVRVSKAAMSDINKQVYRAAQIPKYLVTIAPV
jgi:transposase